MIKSIKVKFSRPALLLIFFALFCCLVACGGSKDEAAGTGTTTGTGQKIALTGSPTSLAAGQNSILTATVTDSAGAAVIGATVSFELVRNNSTGTVVALNGGITDAGGQAVAFYTAGATNPGADVEDTVQAIVAGSTGAVIITRTASTTTTGTDNIFSLTASPSTVSGGQMSILTATVNSGAAYGEVSNQTITFTIPINNSGASLIDSNGASVSTITIPMQLDWASITYISVTYKAGTNVSGTEDVVQAVLGNDSTNSVLITITP